MEDKQLEKLTAFMKRYCKARGLTVYGCGGDRHGSLEWSAFYKDGSMNRTVAFFLTPEMETLGMSATYEVTVIAAVDTDTHFSQRYPVSTFRVSEDFLTKRTFFKQMRNDLNEALQRARGLGLADLTGTYVRPMGP